MALSNGQEFIVGAVVGLTLVSILAASGLLRKAVLFAVATIILAAYVRGGVHGIMAIAEMLQEAFAAEAQTHGKFLLGLGIAAGLCSAVGLAMETRRSRR